MSEAPAKPVEVKSPDEVKQELEQLFSVPNSFAAITEVHAEEAHYVELERELRKEQLKRLREDNEARKRFSLLIFTATVVWMFLVLLIVFQCGKGKLKLSDGVLVALITTATANVFGFFYVVVNYLFNKEKST